MNGGGGGGGGREGGQLKLLIFLNQLTAISRKDVGKSARDNPKRYCGWF